MRKNRSQKIDALNKTIDDYEPSLTCVVETNLAEEEQM